MSASLRGFRRTSFATERTLLRGRKNRYFKRRATTFAILNVPSREIVPSLEPRRNRYETDHRQSNAPGKLKRKLDILELPPKHALNELITLSPAADVRLKLTCNGDVTLWNVVNETEKLVARANLQLPQDHLNASIPRVKIVQCGEDDNHDVKKTIVEWGSRGDENYAELHVTPLQEGGVLSDDWMMVSPTQTNCILSICVCLYKIYVAVYLQCGVHAKEYKMGDVGIVSRRAA